MYVVYSVLSLHRMSNVCWPSKLSDFSRFFNQAQAWRGFLKVRASFLVMWASSFPRFAPSLFLFDRYHIYFSLMKNRTLRSATALSRLSILINVIRLLYVAYESRYIFSSPPRIRWSTYTVWLFRLSLKAMTGVVAVVMTVETDPLSSLSRSTPTDFLHRKTHGQQSRTASASVCSADLLAGRVSPTTAPFSSFISIGSRDLKIIPRRPVDGTAREFSIAKRASSHPTDRLSGLAIATSWFEWLVAVLSHNLTPSRITGTFVFFL